MILEKSRLEGVVKVSGAKNSALRLMAASLLTSERVTLQNYPASISDAAIQAAMLEKLGKTCAFPDGDTLVIEEHDSTPTALVWEGRSIRNTLLMLGALTARKGEAAVPLPGGCQLGSRPFDLHEMVLRALGADVYQENNMLCAVTRNRRLKGADIRLPIRSTGATEHAIVAGSLSEGVTRVWNPHVRPEIVDLVNFLNSMGAKIRVFGQEHIEIAGVDVLGGTTHKIISDNMEAITWLIGTAITGGDVVIRDFPTSDLEVAMIHLRASGASFHSKDNKLFVKAGRCYPLEISTGPHPGINSDVQPIMAAFAAQALGMSRIIDLRFPGRYGYVQEMAKMGVQFQIRDNILSIHGKGGHLRGATVKALDLRAGAALALCALTANSETTVLDAWQIDRGYNNFIQKLQGLKAKVFPLANQASVSAAKQW